MRALDWAATELGPVAEWPDALLNTVNILLAAPLPMQILWGPQFVVLYNDGLRALIADKHPAALGQPGRTVWQDAWPSVGQHLQATLEHGEQVNFRNVPLMLLLNGELTETFWHYSYSPIYGPDGTVLGVLNIAENTTEAVLAGRRQEALRKSERHRRLERKQAGLEKAALTERLQQVMDATTDAVVTVDRDWCMTYFNRRAEELYGPSTQYAGKTVWEAFPFARYDDSPFERHLHAAMHQGLPGHFEAYCPAPFDFWINLSVHPTRDGIVLFSRNVSEARKTHAALLQNEKLAAVGRLASSIAHEINNPLESVTNLLYLARTSSDFNEIQGYLETAERELRRVSAISSQTLRFHKQSTSPRAVTGEDLFDSVLSIYQGRLVNARVEVHRRMRARRPVECFDGEIRQVLTNLVGNAVDAMHPGGGQLWVRSREATDWATGKRGVVLTVGDTGSGMPAEVQSKVFEAFYTTKGIGGTGLGLWVSAEIVERHGGRLRFRSASLPARHGTVFSLFLPLHPDSR